MQKPLHVEMSRPDISPALYAKLLTYLAASASVERSFSMLKSMVHEHRNFTDAHVAFYYKMYLPVEYLTCCNMHI